MLYPQIFQPHPSTLGRSPRQCRICGATFIGPGTLCPTHLAAQAQTRGAQIIAERERSAQIIAARERQAQAARPPRQELRDELDA